MSVGEFRQGLAHMGVALSDGDFSMLLNKVDVDGDKEEMTIRAVRTLGGEVTFLDESNRDGEGGWGLVYPFHTAADMETVISLS